MPHHLDKNLIQFLVVILFFAGGAIVNWIKRRNQSEEPPDTNSEREIPPPPRPTRQPTQPAPPPAASRPPARKINWEEELRRMLGEPETAPPPLPPAPARRETRPAPAPPPVIILPPLQTPRPAPIRPMAVEQERGLPVQFAGLTDSAQSYARASQLDAQVADHLRQISQQVQHHAVRPKADVASLGVAQTLALLRNRQTLRSVIMASVILGPPKALEA